MANFVIMSDSSCDLTDDLKNLYNVDIVPLYVSFDGENYLKENVDITKREFYEKMVSENLFPKTSLPSMEDYINHFKPHLEKGLDILCFTISSGLSGSYQSALNASNIILEEYPDRKILILDSKKATIAQGILVVQAFKLKEKGLSLEEVYSEIEKIKDDGTIIFTIETLDNLLKGGRISKTSAFVGTLLNIKPIVLLKDGILQPHSKVRGRKKSLLEILKIFNESYSNTDEYEIAIAHTNCEQEALELEKNLKEKYGFTLNYPIFEMGCAIGSHTGSGALGIGFVKVCKK